MKKPLNFESSNALFEHLYQDFEQCFEALILKANLDRDNFDQIFNRPLRLFRLRLKLTIGLNLSIDPQYALVRNKSTANTYVQIFKSNEAWSTYEAMLKIASTRHWKKPNVKSAADVFAPETIRMFGVEAVLDVANTLFAQHIMARPNIKNDVVNYLQAMAGKVENKHLAFLLNQTAHKIQQHDLLDHRDLMSIVNGTRNIFVHQGETAKTGAKLYKSKELLHQIVYDYTVLFLLRVAVFEAGNN